MKYILIVIWVAGSNTQPTPGVVMQEFDSPKTCNQAATLLEEMNKITVFCVRK